MRQNTNISENLNTKKDSARKLSFCNKATTSFQGKKVFMKVWDDWKTYC